MTSTEGTMLASRSLHGDAAALLLLLEAVLTSRGDPLSEAMVGDVKRFIYSKTEHSEQAMVKFISEFGAGSSHLAA